MAEADSTAIMHSRTEGSVEGLKSHARRLIAAAHDLLAIAADLEDRTPGGDVNGIEDAALLHDDVRWTALARSHYRDRRLRGALFDETALFGEPAWDMLLDLFINAREGKRVPVTSACIGASVPTTTALRWLAILENRGLIVREADSGDARRVFVRLSPEAQRRMSEYFARSSQGLRMQPNLAPLTMSMNAGTPSKEQGRPPSGERPFMFGK